MTADEHGPLIPGEPAPTTPMDSAAPSGSDRASGRAAGAGGAFSNTPPQTSKTDLFTGGEDWFEVCLYVNWEPHWEALHDRLKQAKEAAGDWERTRHGFDMIAFGEYQASVRASGASVGKNGKGMHYAYVLEVEGLIIQIANKACYRRPMANVVLRVNGLLCLKIGATTALEKGRALIHSMGGEIAEEKLSRVDLCLDMPGVAMDEFVAAYREERFIGRMKKPTFIESEGISLYFGKHPLMLRIYDKAAELKGSKDVLKLFLMLERRWHGEIPAQAIRVEFQVGRAALKMHGIAGPDTYFKKRPDLVGYLCQEWFRFSAGMVDRQNTSRAATLPLWLDVETGFKAWTGKENGESLAPLDQQAVDVEQLVKQSIGAMLTAAVLGGIRSLELKQFLVFVVQHFRRCGYKMNIPQAMARRVARLG